MSTVQEMKKAFSDAHWCAPTAMPVGKYSGRGIVMCVGNDLFPSAYANLNILQKTLGCKLPVEVWYIDDNDLSLSNRTILNKTFPDIPFHTGPQAKGGWQLKPYAILNSSFQEVLLLDADNTPAVDPTSIFNWPQYKETGAVFWPMLTDIMFDQDICEVCNPPRNRVPAFESGQVLLDKSKCFGEVWLTNWLNEQSDFFYKHLYGDKDTFNLAWSITEKPFTLAPRPLVRGQVYYQKSLDKSLLFQHRISPKFSLTAENPKIIGFKYETECFAALEELRKLLPV